MPRSDPAIRWPRRRRAPASDRQASPRARELRQRSSRGYASHRNMQEASMIRRSLLAFGLSTLPWTTLRAQQAYPDRPVRLVIPYPAGGSLDVVGRAIGPRFQEMTGQPLILDNRGGAAGTLAADH